MCNYGKYKVVIKTVKATVYGTECSYGINQ
jgi:hypothetical protein